MKQVSSFSISDSIIKHWSAGLKEATPLKNFRSKEELLKALPDLDGTLLFHTDSSMSLQEDLRDIRKTNPEINVLVLSDIPSFHEGEALLNSAIKGYGNARIHPVALQQAIEVIEAGNHWFYPDFTQHIVAAVAGSSTRVNVEMMGRLSEREQEAAMMVVDGLHNKEIAVKMGITERTVKAHLGAIFAKLDVKDRIGLVLLLRGK